MSPTGPKGADLLEKLLLEQIYDDSTQWIQSGCDPSVFLEMVRLHGPIEACSRAVMQPALLSTSLKLWQMNRLDLTIEALVLRDRFKILFCDPVLVMARQRLAERRS